MNNENFTVPRSVLADLKRQKQWYNVAGILSILQDFADQSQAQPTKVNPIGQPIEQPTEKEISEVVNLMMR